MLEEWRIKLAMWLLSSKKIPLSYSQEFRNFKQMLLDGMATETLDEQLRRKVREYSLDTHLIEIFINGKREAWYNGADNLEHRRRGFKEKLDALLLNRVIYSAAPKGTKFTFEVKFDGETFMEGTYEKG